MRTRVMLLLLFVSALSCGDGIGSLLPPGRVCTLIGCVDGLGVFVQGAPQGPWRVEVSTDTGATRTFDCAPGISCLGAFHPDLLPGRVTIVISANGRSQRYDTTLVTRVSYPNGPQCGPACRSQTITLPLP